MEDNRVAQQIYYEDVVEGQEIPSLKKHPTRRQLVMWAGASEDFYEIHYDTEFAKKNQLGTCIVHGRLKASFLGQLLTDWIGGEGVLQKMSCRYRGTDLVDTDMFIKGTVTKKYVEGNEHRIELDVWTEKEDGVKTTQGAATVVLPSRSN